MLFGRYPGDSYAGGNPWQLLTACVAKIFYQGANTMIQSNGFSREADKDAWADLLSLDENASTMDFIQASLNAGDSIMNRLYKYVKNDDGHIAEQIGRSTGEQKSAKDLTWSYANILSAMQARKNSIQAFELYKQIESQ